MKAFAAPTRAIVETVARRVMVIVKLVLLLSEVGNCGFNIISQQATQKQQSWTCVRVRRVIARGEEEGRAAKTKNLAGSYVCTYLARAREEKAVAAASLQTPCPCHHQHQNK